MTFLLISSQAAFIRRNISFPAARSFRPGSCKRPNDATDEFSVRPSSAAAPDPQSSAPVGIQQSWEDHPPPKRLPHQIPIDGQLLAAFPRVPSSEAFRRRPPVPGRLLAPGPASETLPDSGRSRDHKESRGPALERGRTDRSHDQMVAGLGPIYLPKRLQPTSVGRLRRSATRPRAPRRKAIAARPDEASISGAEIVPWLPPLPLPLLPLPLPADACVTAPRARAEAIPSAPMIRRSNIFQHTPSSWTVSAARYAHPTRKLQTKLVPFEAIIGRIRWSPEKKAEVPRNRQDG